VKVMRVMWYACLVLMTLALLAAFPTAVV